MFGTILNRLHVTTVKKHSSATSNTPIIESTYTDLRRQMNQARAMKVQRGRPLEQKWTTKRNVLTRTPIRFRWWRREYRVMFVVVFFPAQRPLRVTEKRTIMKANDSSAKFARTDSIRKPIWNSTSVFTQTNGNLPLHHSPYTAVSLNFMSSFQPIQMRPVSQVIFSRIGSQLPSPRTYRRTVSHQHEGD